MSKRGLLIFNSRAGRQDPDLQDLLRRELPDADILSVDELNDLAERSTHHSYVAIAGGDGTVERLATTLIDGPVPLGIVPVGTYNNLARSLDIPIDPVAACAVIRTGTPRAMDVGVANRGTFFECLGVGLDAAIYPLGEEIKSGRLHRWIDLLRKAFRYPRMKFHLTLDRPVCEALVDGTANESRHLVHRLRKQNSREITLNALMLNVSNGPLFGMNFAIAPRQRLDDGQLTVTVFSRYSKLQMFWHFFSLAFGGHEFCPKAIAFQTTSLQIETAPSAPVHLDGNPQEIVWPLTVSCHHRALNVFRP